jgi:hypothetical protein
VRKGERIGAVAPLAARAAIGATEDQRVTEAASQGPKNKTMLRIG